MMVTCYQRAPTVLAVEIGNGSVINGDHHQLRTPLKHFNGGDRSRRSRLQSTNICRSVDPLLTAARAEAKNEIYTWLPVPTTRARPFNRKTGQKCQREQTGKGLDSIPAGEPSFLPPKQKTQSFEVGSKSIFPTQLPKTGQGNTVTETSRNPWEFHSRKPHG